MINKYLLHLCILIVPLWSQVSVIDDSVYSHSIHSYCHLSVLLPDGYKNGGQQYPVIYLLHGFNGDNTSWFTSTHLIEYSKASRCIIVSPDAKNSWYANSVTKPNSNYEDLVMKDIIPFIDKNYRTLQDKQHRAIGGMSMGGYGALKYGLKYHDKFFYVAGLSPSIQFPAGLEDSAIVARRSAASNKSVREAFGAERNERWNENDFYFLLEHSIGTQLPYFYLSAGSQDGIPEIITMTHEFAGRLRKKGVKFEMHETRGAHDWQFWDKEIEIVLNSLSEQWK